MKSLHAAPRRPNIAITPDLTGPNATVLLPRYELRAAYADAVLKAGGLPMVLPYSEDRSCIDAWLDRVSGVVFTGGAFDVPPPLYGETPRDGLGELKPARTSFELALMRGALQRKLPILGICGGMQLLNVALGGTLVQDIEKELPQAKPHQQSHDRSQPAHPVDVKDGTLLADCVGKGQLMVNSTHHQCVKVVPNELVAAAVAPDGVVEAIESRDHPFVLGVQWHPELLIETVPTQLGIFRAFIARARDRRH